MTSYAKKDEYKREWLVIDATNKILGELAVTIAVHLRGKHKPVFTPNVDTGDFIIVINAEKVRVTGNKLDKKMYHRHSGYPGGYKSEALRHLLKRKPEDVIYKAVWGMIPKNRLGRDLYKKLKVYSGAEHPHSAQKPLALSI
ncbi:MAG: 50S ribosomal protein L13 [Nitrospirae bacterium]|nr:50S ribosomal protein L13 [Nitrospirota bacterium]